MALSNQPRSLIGLEKAINFLKQRMNDPDVSPEFKAEAQRRIQIYSAQSSKLSSTASKVVRSRIAATGKLENKDDAELAKKVQNKTVEFSDVGLTPTAAAGNSMFAKVSNRLQGISYLNMLKFGIAAYVVDALIPAGALGNAVNAISLFLKSHPDFLANIATKLISGNVVGAAILGAIAVVGVVKLLAPAVKKHLAKKALDREMLGMDFDNMAIDPSKETSIEDALKDYDAKSKKKETKEEKTEDKSEEKKEKGGTKRKTTKKAKEKEEKTEEEKTDETTPVEKAAKERDYAVYALIAAKRNVEEAKEKVSKKDKAYKNAQAELSDDTTNTKLQENLRIAKKEFEDAQKLLNDANEIVKQAKTTLKASTKAFDNAVEKHVQEIADLQTFDDDKQKEAFIEVSVKEHHINFGLSAANYSTWEARNNSKQEKNDIASFISGLDEENLTKAAKINEVKDSWIKKIEDKKQISVHKEYAAIEKGDKTLPKLSLYLEPVEGKKSTYLPDYKKFKSLTKDDLTQHQKDIESRLQYEQELGEKYYIEYNHELENYLAIKLEIQAKLAYYSAKDPSELDTDVHAEYAQLENALKASENTLKKLADNINNKRAICHGLEWYMKGITKAQLENENLKTDLKDAQDEAKPAMPKNEKDTNKNRKAYEKFVLNLETAYKNILNQTKPSAENPKPTTSKELKELIGSMEYEKNPQAEKLKTYFGKLVEVMELLENVAEVIKDKDAAERKKILEAKAKELGVESLLTTKESS